MPKASNLRPFSRIPTFFSALCITIELDITSEIYVIYIYQDYGWMHIDIYVQMYKIQNMSKIRSTQQYIYICTLYIYISKTYIQMGVSQNGGAPVVTIGHP
jgi:hypothetical protein